MLLTEEMVAAMRPGSVIVDISIDQGGNCAITTPGETAVKHHVTIEGIKNIPGMLRPAPPGCLQTISITW